MTEIKVCYDGPIVKRKDALMMGATHYFTGKPCKYGHVDRRQVCNWDCVECVRLRNLEWRKNNPERVYDLDREWFIKNRDRKFAHCKKWSDGNPEKVRQFRLNAIARRNDADGSFTSSDISVILERQRWKCASCNISLKIAYHIDHIMPLALGGSNWPSNLQCLCPRCNLSKGAKHPVDWAMLNGRLV